MPGVVGRKPIHLLELEQRKKVVELKGMHIDIGAADRDEAAELIRVGDPAVIAAEPVRGRRRPAGLALDGQPARRLRRPRERCAAPTSATPCRTPASPASPRSRRRSACSAPAPSAFEVQPDLAIAVDVTHATDAPGVDEKEVGSHPLGSGPVIGRGSTLSPKVFELLVETAEDGGDRATRSAPAAAAPAPTPT